MYDATTCLTPTHGSCNGTNMALFAHVKQLTCSLFLVHKHVQSAVKLRANSKTRLLYICENKISPVQKDVVTNNASRHHLSCNLTWRIHEGLGLARLTTLRTHEGLTRMAGLHICLGVFCMEAPPFDSLPCELDPASGQHSLGTTCNMQS